MRLALSIGDVAGIGPEVILKALERPVADDVCVVVYGDLDALRLENERLGDSGLADSLFRERFVEVGSPESVNEADVVGVLDVLPDEDVADVEKGVKDERCARLQREAFQRAVDDVIGELADAVVTAPWNKSLFELIGEPAVGHTDILDDLFPTSIPTMMLAGPRLRVSLVTTHVPLTRVADRVRRRSLRRVVRTTIGGLRQRFGVDQPELAVCGLNPHAGEGGAMGREEVELIEPVLDELRREVEGSCRIDGPLPSDTLFTKFRDGGSPYDAVICMYHDQGLIPLKLLHFGQSANVTLGLPLIRTSVDHGTAYDIAGQGRADPGSMLYALELAADMVRRS